MRPMNAPMHQIIVYLALDELIGNPVQPADRTTVAATANLEADMRRTNVCVPLLVMFRATDTLKDIIDGHRRLAVARRIGYTHVPCIIMPVGYKHKHTASDSFVAFNASTRPITGRNWLTIYAKDPATLSTFSKITRENIEYLIELIGEDETIRIGLTGMQAPSIVKHVGRMIATLNTFRATADRVKGSAVFYWLIKHPQQRAVVELLKGSTTQAKAMKLLRAIENDRPLAA